MRPGDTPVPIPNTTVKAWAADGTALETAWESRREKKKKKRALPVIQAGERDPRFGWLMEHQPYRTLKTAYMLV